MTAGYSGKPLAQKLGLKPDARVYLHNAPEAYPMWLGLAEPPAALARLEPFDFAHAFFLRRSELQTTLPRLLEHLAPGGMIWVSWAKKSAKLETDITEDTVREVALPLGLVDVKVCAVSEVWSGLKLLRRRATSS